MPESPVSGLLDPVDYLPVENPEAQQVFDLFIASLVKEMGMNSEKVNITSILPASDNPYINTKSLTELLFAAALRWDSWHDLGKDLIAWYTYPEAGFSLLDFELRLNYSRHDTMGKSTYEEVIKKAEFAT
ncbi:uncharacterized protein FRV6_01168 [Fusarium oxysporum]|uniref:Uncharacterized protein n=1 Tax=Fusarium oxysporum TaxID=5507 RepID=A0A2H3SKK3_FUSOX|nr:uncharacterized protein FRV6_01168 [Fusarium oxysporum]